MGQTTLLPRGSIASASPKAGAEVPTPKPTFCGLRGSPVKPQAAEAGFRVAHAGVNHVLPSSRDPAPQSSAPRRCMGHKVPVRSLGSNSLKRGISTESRSVRVSRALWYHIYLAFPHLAFTVLYEQRKQDQKQLFGFVRLSFHPALHLQPALPVRC